jgi:hypothetical protein
MTQLTRIVQIYRLFMIWGESLSMTHTPLRSDLSLGQDKRVIIVPILLLCGSFIVLVVCFIPVLDSHALYDCSSIGHRN